MALSIALIFNIWVWVPACGCPRQQEVKVVTGNPIGSNLIKDTVPASMSIVSPAAFSNLTVHFLTSMDPTSFNPSSVQLKTYNPLLINWAQCGLCGPPGPVRTIQSVSWVTSAQPNDTMIITFAGSPQPCTVYEFTFPLGSFYNASRTMYLSSDVTVAIAVQTPTGTLPALSSSNIPGALSWPPHGEIDFGFSQNMGLYSLAINPMNGISNIYSTAKSVSVCSVPGLDMGTTYDFTFWSTDAPLGLPATRGACGDPLTNGIPNASTPGGVLRTVTIGDTKIASPGDLSCNNPPDDILSVDSPITIQGYLPAAATNGCLGSLTHFSGYNFATSPPTDLSGTGQDARSTFGTDVLGPVTTIGSAQVRPFAAQMYVGLPANLGFPEDLTIRLTNSYDGVGFGNVCPTVDQSDSIKVRYDPPIHWGNVIVPTAAIANTLKGAILTFGETNTIEGNTFDLKAIPWTHINDGDIYYFWPSGGKLHINNASFSHLSDNQPVDGATYYGGGAFQLSLQTSLYVTMTSGSYVGTCQVFDGNFRLIDAAIKIIFVPILTDPVYYFDPNTLLVTSLMVEPSHLRFFVPEYVTYFLGYPSYPGVKVSLSNLAGIPCWGGNPANPGDFNDAVNKALNSTTFGDLLGPNFVKDLLRFCGGFLNTFQPDDGVCIIGSQCYASEREVYFEKNPNLGFYVTSLGSGVEQVRLPYRRCIQGCRHFCSRCIRPPYKDQVLNYQETINAWFKLYRGDTPSTGGEATSEVCY